MEKKDYDNYLAPMVKVVSFSIEKGFAGSPFSSSESDENSENGIDNVDEYQGDNNSLDGEYFQ